MPVAHTKPCPPGQFPTPGAIQRPGYFMRFVGRIPKTRRALGLSCITRIFIKTLCYHQRGKFVFLASTHKQIGRVRSLVRHRGLFAPRRSLESEIARWTTKRMKYPGRRLRKLLARCVLILCGMSTPAAGSPNHMTVLYELGNDDYAVRQSATQRLLADEADLETLGQLYTKAKLPEQRQRLLNVACHYTVKRMRLKIASNNNKAAIGIRHDAFGTDRFPGIARPGLIVVETFPGFPGHAHLQRSDLILAVDGQPFPIDLTPQQTANRFIQTVQKKEAGSSARFTVYRDGRTIEVRFHLASLHALQTMYKNAQKLQPKFQTQWLTTRRQLVADQPDAPTLTVSPQPDNGTAP